MAGDRFPFAPRGSGFGPGDTLNGENADMENVFFQPEDRVLCESLLASAAKNEDRLKTLPEIAVALAKHFIGSPYSPQILSTGIAETLTANLQSFDCVTFVESVVAMALTIQSGGTELSHFLHMLEKIRYRNGRMNGYPSRLHYFTDWIWDNEKKGILTDVTDALGGIPTTKRFSFITSGRQGCPPLRDGAALLEMLLAEDACAGRGFYTIPKRNWSKAEAEVQDGDIIAIVSNRDDIDVLHVGFAVRVNQKARLLHASSKTGSVVISDSTLNHYLREKSSRTGVVVARLLPSPPNASAGAASLMLS